jgi:hypothetical protein
MPIQVAIPAAGRIRDSTDAETLVCPLFRTITGKPFISLILEKLKASNLEIGTIAIGIHAADQEQLEFLLQPFSRDLEFAVKICDHTNNVVETLAELVTPFNVGEKILVNLGDSLVDIEWEKVVSSDFGLGVTNDTMPIDRLATYDFSAPNGTVSKRGIVGVYWFTKRSVQLEVGTISSVEDLVLSAGSSPVIVEASTWIDADYSDRFSREANLNFESRSFNSVKRPPGSNLIYKSSSKVEKLRSEYEYIVGLDPEAASLFPAVRSFEIRGDIGVLAMDYWPYSNLSDMYCFSNLTEGFWGALMSQVKSILSTLRSDAMTSNGELFHWAFIEKTRNRLTQLEQKVDWFEAAIGFQQINGRECESAHDLLGMAEAFFAKTDRFAGRVHGDFCFSNILVDPGSMMIKLVDPRGGFIEDGLVGPLDYDLAKFAHSVLGDYDLILKGLYDLSGADLRQQTFEVHYPPHRATVTRAFRQHLTESDFDLETLRLLSALILISIPPLHLEDENRARMFLIKGRYDAQIALRRLNEML